jgi:cyclase
MDIVASLYGRNNLLDVVRRTAQEIFIPLTVGGGLRTIDDIYAVLAAGADKVSINTAAIRNPEFIQEASRRFGSSTIVVAIEAIKKDNPKYEVCVDNGRQETGIDVFAWAKRVAKLGAGEILLTSIDQEGTGKGFDIELIREVAQSVSIPVIALGGAGSIEHIYAAIAEGNADAVSIASMLHYGFLKEFDMLKHDYSEEGNTEYLKNKQDFGKVKGTSIFEIKSFIKNKGINCRL